MDKLIPIGRKIIIDKPGALASDAGRIIAYYISAENFDATPALYYVVQLEQGFYSEGRKHYVSVLTAHAENVYEATYDGKKVSR